MKKSVIKKVLLIVLIMSFLLQLSTYEKCFEVKGDSYSWTLMNKGLHDLLVTSLVIDPINTSMLYVGTNSGVYKSTDGGNNWEISGLINLATICFAIMPIDTNTIYAGTYGGGFFKSTDGGTNWEAKNTGLGDLGVSSIVIDPKSTNIIYVATNGGVYKSIDGGNSWEAKNSGLTKLYAISLVIDPINTSMLYVGTNSGVYKSTDGGNSWEAKNTGLVGNLWITSLAIDPKNTNVIYACTDGNGVFKSIDGGKNWSKKGLSNTRISTIAIDRSNTNIAYLGTPGGEGVFKTIDAGENWFNIGLGNLSVRSLAIDPKNTSIVYACRPSAGIFKLIPLTLPFPPQNLSLTFSDSSVTLTWDTPPPQGTYPIAGYKIYKGISSGGESSTPIASIPASINTYTDTNVSSGITYYYYVKAFDNQNPPNYSEPSKEVNTKTNMETIIIILEIGNKNFTVNDENRALDSPPIIKNNRTLLPIRAVVEALGGTIGWNATERKVTIYFGYKKIELWIGRSFARINDKDVCIDTTNPKVVPEIINSRTMLPLRFVTENLGCDVQWDGPTQTITITYQG
jgi:photosystem II stability/assembly factor-like uncharacterized protein